MGWLLFFSVVIIAIVIWVFKTNTITEYYDSGIIKLSRKTSFGKSEFRHYDKKGSCYCVNKYSLGELIKQDFFLIYAHDEITSNREIILQATKKSYIRTQ